MSKGRTPPAPERFHVPDNAVQPEGFDLIGASDERDGLVCLTFEGMPPIVLGLDEAKQLLNALSVTINKVEIGLEQIAAGKQPRATLIA